MNLSPDNIIYWQMSFFKLNATIVYTWGLILVLGSKMIIRKLSTKWQLSCWQNLPEVMNSKEQISWKPEIMGRREPDIYSLRKPLPF